MTRRELGDDIQSAIVAFARRGALEIEHPGGTLLDHLVRTGEALRSWGAADDLVLAGVAHAAYGTDGFDTAPFALDERSTVAEVIGEDAETLVYLYASCDRRATLPRIGRSENAMFHDRFTGTSRTLSAREHHSLAELTVANELDLVRHSPVFHDEHGPALRALFTAWTDVVSEGARMSVQELLSPTWSGPRDGHVPVGSLRLHYLEWGLPSAPTVLFLHGGGLNAHSWDRVCTQLRDRYHCLAVDLRGHGDSEWSPAAEYTVAAHREDLAHVIEELGLSRPVIVGHSLGGHAAMAYAVDHASELTGLVIVDTSPFPRHTPTLARIRAYAAGASEYASLDEAVEHARSFRPNTDPARLRHALLHSLRLLPDGRWTWKRDRRGIDDKYIDDQIADVRALIPRIADITCPTLVVRGERGVVSAEDARRFVTSLLSGRTVTIRAAGHNVHSDEPDALAQRIDEFLGELHRVGPRRRSPGAPPRQTRAPSRGR
jgi:pimeloyl-ACP methyl ester carboxylesterase